MSILSRIRIPGSPFAIRRIAPLILNVGFLVPGACLAVSSVDGTALLQFDVRASDGVLRYDRSESSLFGIVGSIGGGITTESSLATSSSGAYLSGYASTEANHWITGTTSYSDSRHFSSAEFVINPGLDDTSSGAQLLTSGRVMFSVTGLQQPTFDLHLDLFEYRLRLSLAADSHPGSFSDGSVRWLVELRYSLPGNSDESVQSITANEPYLVRHGESGFVDVSRRESANFDGIPADAVNLSLGWATVAEGRAVVAVPEPEASTQLLMLIAGACMGIGILRRGRPGGNRV